MKPLLAIESLRIDIRSGRDDTRRVVDDVSLVVERGTIAALVGESGSGKTLIGRSVLRLLPPVASIAGGEIVFESRALSTLSDAQLRSLRGRRIGAVFQEPMVSLNPALSVGFQMMEAMLLHERLSKAEARRRCVAMLEKVRIADPDDALRAYPHQFSGGMRQRIMLASVLAMRPALLIADEPTTALDALIRKEIMDLMVALTRETGTAVLLISHDLALVAQYAAEVTVLQKGRVLEQGSPRRMLLKPTHDYTRALMAALPARVASASQARRPPLIEV